MDHAPGEPVEHLQEHDEVDAGAEYDASVRASLNHPVPRLYVFLSFLVVH